MKKRILCFLLTLVLICQLLTVNLNTVNASSGAGTVIALDNYSGYSDNVSLNFKIVITTTNACSATDANCAASYIHIDGYGDIYLNKSLMKDKGNTKTVTFTSTNFPYGCYLQLASGMSSLRSYGCDIAFYCENKSYGTTKLSASGGNMSLHLTRPMFETEPGFPSISEGFVSPASTTITASVSSTVNTNFSVYAKTNYGFDAAAAGKTIYPQSEDYYSPTKETMIGKVKQDTIRIVNTSNQAISIPGISLDPASKKIKVSPEFITGYSGTSATFKIAADVGIYANGYFHNNLKTVYSSVITVTKPGSITFRYHPGGGSQPDNYKSWTAKPADSFPDSHWNYTNGQYAMTRHGYTATGYYAKADGSCSIHEDYNFTNYADLCAKYGVSTTGTHTIDIYAQWAPINYTVTFNGNGATGGSMANQSFAYDTPQALKPNAFERVYTVTYNENGGAELPDGKAVATFNGWQDRGSIVYKDGTTYTFADFDGAGYGLRNNDVFVSSGFGNGIFNKYGLLDHYVIHGKGEYANGSTSRAPTTDEPYGYPNGATVSNLSTTNGATVPLYALWTPGSVILPTPTKAGHTFNGWYTEATGGTKVGVAGASYTPAANTTLYAQWTANSYTVNVSATPTESGTVGGGSYDYGASATVTATANNGYRFVNWTENGTSVSTDASYTFTATGARNLVANFELITYTVTWKNYDGTVLETDTGVAPGTTPEYGGTAPEKPEDENFTYTFDGWSPTVSAVTGDTEYTAQFTAVSKRVDPAYTVTIPAAVTEGESFTVKATGVVLNTDQTLTVTLQSDFKLRNEQGAELPFVINNGNIGNNAVILTIAGNGDKNTPLVKDSEALRIQVAEEAKYSGAYTGTITFVVAVNTAENN